MIRRKCCGLLAESAEYLFQPIFRVADKSAEGIENNDSCKIRSAFEELGLTFVQLGGILVRETALFLLGLSQRLREMSDGA